MNERIRECADGAGLDSNWKPGFNSIYGQQLEKFAQLLITETINELCQQMYWHGIDFSNYPKFYIAIEKTENHFGVK